ncbi:MAG: hypothetical protein ACI4VQ_01635, partial [Clostridia bacterium]
MIGELKLHIDTVGFEDKKSVKRDVGAIKNRVQKSEPIKIDVDGFVKAIESGKTFSPAIMKGTTKNDFIEQQIFPVDIDNNNGNLPILQIQDAINICNQNNLPLAFYYPSFSHTEEKPKYRLVFILDKAITDRDERNSIMNYLCSLFEQADKSCINEDRIFYGTDKKVIKCDTTNPVKAEDILKLLPAKVDKELSNQSASKNYDNELEKLKQEFDFCNYLAERNGGIKSNSGDYVAFYNCEVCGHRDDLRYYKDNNTFKCFGANGGQSGSIIDYLMIVENLTLKQAIDKFKYELCGIERK